MLFPTHLVAGYLCAHRWDLAPAWAVAGAVAPDLIDKPVAMLGFYGLYHSAGHSLLAGGVLALAALVVGRPAVGLCVGWGSHLLLDALHMMVNGRPGDVYFLAWPFVEHTPSVSLPPLEFAAVYLGTPSFYLELLLWGIMAAVLLDRRRGRPAAGE